MKVIQLKIKGMTCTSCSASVERSVNKLSGVTKQEISHITNSGVFTYDENIVSEQELISKINEGHYKVEGYENIQAVPKVEIPVCPQCVQKGQLVPNTVFKSFLKPESKEKVDLNADNFICMTPECSIAYYNSENKKTIQKDELKRELWYKTGTKTVLACYCNNIDTDKLKEAVTVHNLISWEQITSHYRKKVIEKCEKLNPRGSCCKSSFDQLVSEIK